MSRTSASIDLNAKALQAARRILLLSGMVAASSLALGQTTVPDAQVEANVLKALAASSELASEAITTRTVYGTVTLSGSVASEFARTRAENLAANAAGVVKVVDELTLASAPTSIPPAPVQPALSQAAQNQAPSDASAQPLVLQSDGSYAAAPSSGEQSAAPAPGTAPATMAQRNDPETDQALDQQMQQPNASMPSPAPPAGAQADAKQPSANAGSQPPYPPQPQRRRPIYTPGYPGYGYPQQPPQGYAQQQPGGQPAGQPVIIPVGALLRVRINHTLSSSHSQPGATFDGTVVSDVVANGFVAIPRGAAVQGKVLDAKSSGALKGRGELSIQLTQVTLAGHVYPLTSDIFAPHGGDKTIETVNKTAGFGVAGALIGALAGGGKGAAIGAGVGAAAGVGSSAASGNGQVFIPAEAVLTFHTAGETQVATVSEQEMQRLAYGVPAMGDQPPPPRRVYRVYPGYYPPPGYYPYPGYAYPYPTY